MKELRVQCLTRVGLRVMGFSDSGFKDSGSGKRGGGKSRITYHPQSTPKSPVPNSWIILGYLVS